MLGRNRRLTVESFKGAVRIDIREYYDSDGELKPGKKGISLRLSLWNTLKDKIQDINSCITADESLLVDLEKLLKISVTKYQGLPFVKCTINAYIYTSAYVHTYICNVYFYLPSDLLYTYECSISVRMRK